ncbi:hypothetical protein LP419_05130 [Massilia sp. H-1]|nr:hypothetical protein LP419_05130 [Massilia sp. H-1]
MDISTRVLLRWVLLLQVGAVALIAWLAHGAGAGWPLAVAAAVGVLLLVRVLITANNFVLTRRFSSTTPAEFALGPGGRIALFAEEFMATLLQSSWFMARDAAPASVCGCAVRAATVVARLRLQQRLLGPADAPPRCLAHQPCLARPGTDHGRDRRLRPHGAGGGGLAVRADGGARRDHRGPQHGRPGGARLAARTGRVSSCIYSPSARRTTAPAWRRWAWARMRPRCGARMATARPTAAAPGCARWRRRKPRTRAP